MAFGIPLLNEVHLSTAVSNLKDQFFLPETIRKLGNNLETVHAGFSAQDFVSTVLSDPWDSLELMDRMRRVADCVREHLPDDYPEALNILRSAAAGIEGFDSLVFPDFVQRYGLEYPDESIAALQHFTELCSSEFAVRPFIMQYPKRMFKQLKRWAKSKNQHHRRLASEGCRPRLPWAAALKDLKKDPTPIFAILEILKEDSELYVRRSVANNLNDISKDHPNRVIELAKRWKGNSEHTDWIIKHACRTLLKQGRTEVLQLFGFSSPDSIHVAPLEWDRKQIAIGDSIVFSSKIQTSKASLGKLRLEYVVHFVKKNGTTSPKVFHISERMEQAKEMSIEKRHRFADLSTRKHYPGTHRFELRVNGVVKSEGEIELA